MKNKKKNLFELFNALNGTDLKKPNNIIPKSLMQAVSMNGFTINKNNDPNTETTFVGNNVDEAISETFEDKGGIIVFSTDINAVQLDPNKIKNYIYQKLTSLSNYINKKVTDVLSKHEGVYGFTLGNFVKGRYFSEGKTYDEHSTSVEIIGIPESTLINIAEDICREFNQESVLVKVYETNQIHLVTP